jgi:hypothetical protein
MTRWRSGWLSGVEWRGDTSHPGTSMTDKHSSAKGLMTLHDSDIGTQPTASRRSALLWVGAIATGVTAGAAKAQGTSDSDPNDPAGQGRRAPTGVTDSDTGPNADPARGGRGGGSQSCGPTDSDTGANGDPACQGRGPRSGGAPPRAPQAPAARATEPPRRRIVDF